MAEAIRSGNINTFLLALCGWSADTLVRLAEIQLMDACAAEEKGECTLKRNRKKKSKLTRCHHCSCCLPVGEGDYFCDELLELVFENYLPTEHYCGCLKKGRERVKNMGKHTVTVQIPAQEVSRVNRLLAIVSPEELTDSELIEQGANTNQNEEIFCATFDDGSSLRFYLCSGLYRLSISKPAVLLFVFCRKNGSILTFFRTN